MKINKSQLKRILAENEPGYILPKKQFSHVYKAVAKRVKREVNMIKIETNSLGDKTYIAIPPDSKDKIFFSYKKLGVDSSFTHKADVKKALRNLENRRLKLEIQQAKALDCEVDHVIPLWKHIEKWMKLNKLNFDDIMLVENYHKIKLLKDKKLERSWGEYMSRQRVQLLPKELHEIKTRRDTQTYLANRS